MDDNTLEFLARPATKIYKKGDFVFFEQDVQGETVSVAIPVCDLPKIIDYLCGIAGIGGSRS